MDLVQRFDIYFVQLGPFFGSEINKMRPCVIVSSTDINRVLNTVIVAPLTSTLRNYPSRINCVVDRKNGQIALNQMRTIDKLRLIKKLGILDQIIGKVALEKLVETFS